MGAAAVLEPCAASIALASEAFVATMYTDGRNGRRGIVTALHQAAHLVLEMDILVHALGQQIAGAAAEVLAAIREGPHLQPSCAFANGWIANHA